MLGWEGQNKGFGSLLFGSLPMLEAEYISANKFLLMDRHISLFLQQLLCDQDSQWHKVECQCQNQRKFHSGRLD